MNQSNLGIIVLSTLLVGLSGASIAIYSNMNHSDEIEQTDETKLLTNNENNTDFITDINEENITATIRENDMVTKQISVKKKKEKTKRNKTKNGNTKRRYYQ
jgi:hypothetical protein